MLIIGCDFHPSFQMIAMLDTETGEVTGRRLGHTAEAEQFYRSLPQPARVGLEAGGHSQWFQRLLAELGHELWVGDPARIRASYVRRQKTDRRDCQHMLQLLREGRFPRLWTPSLEERDARQLLVHRHQRVRMRTQVKNQLQALALNQGLQKKRALWTQAGREQLQALALLPYAAQRRERLLATLEQLDAEIAELDQAVAAEARRRPQAVRLMQQPGVGPQTALAFVLTIGPVERFAGSKQVSSYLGLIPREHSSGGHQRLGHISKQGSPLLRFLLVEAAQSAVRLDPELRRAYLRCAVNKGRAKAKVAAARRLAVKLYWRLRNGDDDAQR
jgi:transposase